MMAFLIPEYSKYGSVFNFLVHYFGKIVVSFGFVRLLPQQLIVDGLLLISQSV